MLNEETEMEMNGISGSESFYRDVHQPGLIIAGCFAAVAVSLSFFLILQHLRSYTNPSIISMWNPRLSLACDILRNCYEAFALYSFGSYLVACLGKSLARGESSVIELLENQSKKQPISKPLLDEAGENRIEQHKSLRNFFFRPSVIGKDLLAIEKFGLVQYMILKTLCAFLAFLLEIFGVYGDGEFKWYYGYPYMAVVLNFSQMWALYCLVQFYNVTHERLQCIKPLAKFVSFKAIVFATWWQGVGIALLHEIGVLPKEGKLQTALQDFLICIEMAMAAVAHEFVFSAKPYHYISASEYGKLTTEIMKGEVKLEEGDAPAVLEKQEIKVEAPGTSVTESVQDIVLKGGQHVVKDVVLTINQAICPVEKGVTKIQETFHRKSVSSDIEADESELKVKQHIDENLTSETHIP
ncbi:hypothetical protein TIFTF001_022096 [Ficus carica]|uniref:Protein LAZ1 homolog 2 n=1 Tax=Ficus carica TaxID=3494 RepID=A0AA88ABX3_FICCA|nr:hypothetical protein TIFTF001_022096 [Ficus carica]